MKWNLWVLLLGLAANNSYPQNTWRHWLDQNIKPQNDFFHYANQNWIKTHPIPTTEAEWSVFNELKQEIDLELKQTLANLHKYPQLNQNPLFHQLTIFYKSGLDQQQIEKAGITAIQPLITEIKQVKDSTDLAKILAKLHHYDIPAFFDVYPYTDLHQPNFVIAGINQPALILPDRSYYLDKSKEHQNIIHAYQDFLGIIFSQLGYPEEKRKIAIQHVLKIETQLARFSANRDFFRQPKNVDHVYSLETLIQKFKALQLATYFDYLQLNPHQINLTNPQYFIRLNQWIDKLPNEEIQDYLLAMMVTELAEYLPPPFAEPACDFLKKIRGNQICPQPWERILQNLNQYLGFALGELYVASRPKDNTVQYVTEIYENIRKSLKFKILNNHWLSQPTKSKALLKLTTMKSRIGYPPPLDYQRLKIDSKIYINNVLSARYFEVERQLTKINKKLDPKEWDMPPQSINAYYSVSQNQINIPLGILQAPFFSPHASGAANYGGIGVVIGHEMFHGFDDEGSQFDEKGRLHSWWSKKEWQMYQSQVRCIQRQFSNYPIPNTKLKVNGKLVSGEAIADLGGIHLARAAYLHSPQFKQDKTIDGFSPIQQFYISFAQIWASNILPLEAQRKGLTDPHPPKILRVNGTVRNCPSFYQAFHLTEPQDYCQLF